jgi:uncharacterized protein
MSALRLNRLWLGLIQVLINSLEFAEQSLEIHDNIRASNLPALQDVLFSDRGELEYVLIGRRAGREQLTLQLKVNGIVDLICQRCLGEIAYRIEVDRLFELVKDESAIPASDMDNDEIDYLVADVEMDVVALVEEEILLSLPLALRHDEVCNVSEFQSSGLKPNPFRVLEGLKAGTKN